MPLNTIAGDTYVAGNLSATSMQISGNSVGNASVIAGAAIDCTKLQQQVHATYAQARGSAAATARAVIHCCRGAGSIESLRVGVTQAAVGAATVDTHLKKNGSNVTSAAVQIDSGDAAFAEVTGSFSDDDYVDGDVYEVDITATAGGGTLPQGLYVSLVLRGSAQ